MMTECVFNQKLIDSNGVTDSASFKLARFEKGTRYYTIILEQDLFKDWVITVINGRINTKLGRIRKLAFQNCSDAVLKFDAITRTRIKRKYLLNSCSEKI